VAGLIIFALASSPSPPDRGERAGVRGVAETSRLPAVIFVPVAVLLNVQLPERKGCISLGD